jgi:hypothetical protein
MCCFTAKTVLEDNTQPAVLEFQLMRAPREHNLNLCFVILLTLISLLTLDTISDYNPVELINLLF